MALVFCCSEDNDLYGVVTEMGWAARRSDGPDEALALAQPGDGLLILADGYPKATVELDGAWVEQALDKGLRLFVEYPAAFPGIELGAPRPTEWERVVVSGDMFGQTLPAGRILALHDCWFLPTVADEPQMVVARVAGFHQVAYGLPDEGYPILFAAGDDTLIATSKLSQFRTARYGPTGDWQVLWTTLLRWLARDDGLPQLTWAPTVGVQAGPEVELAEGVEGAAVDRSVRWFRRHILYSISEKKGAIEGYESGIDYEGYQRPRIWPRADCIGETAMVFATDWARTGNPASRRIACQLLDYVWSADFYHDDPASPMYGLLDWSEGNPVFYGDDNARVILPTLAARRLLGESRWDEPVLRCILANYRTAGVYGFRQNRLEAPQFAGAAQGKETTGFAVSAVAAPADAWKAFHEQETVIYAPHYQCYIWACYLWGYGLTGYTPLLEAARTAIRMTMEAYPTGWRWTNGLSQEMARITLPLAFLCQVDDGPAPRQWLATILDDLLGQQVACGAIRELLGDLQMGKYPPPRSNEDYGTTEASLIQANGDPICDLVYAANFALLGLHEAARVSDEARVQSAEDGLAQFLVRIQGRSDDHPYLNGAWMRSFDYELWEYWGSSADLGWGAWCVESGWTNTWINSVLAWRQMDAGLFDLGDSDALRAMMPRLVAEMGLA